MNKDNKSSKINQKKISKNVSSTPQYSKYSALERRAARELYYQLGENRSLDKVFKILGINLSTLKIWSGEEHWKDWAEARSKEDEKLALQGKYSTQILGLNAKAKAFLETIIEKSAEKINHEKFDIRASDAVNAAKELLRLVEADKAPDVLNTAVPIIVVVDKKEYEQEQQNIKKDIEINIQNQEAQN